MKLTEEGLEGWDGSDVAMEMQPVPRAIGRGHKKDPNLDVSAGSAGKRYTEKTGVSHANVIPNNDHVTQPGLSMLRLSSRLIAGRKGSETCTLSRPQAEQKILNCAFPCLCHGIASLDS